MRNNRADKNAILAAFDRLGNRKQVSAELGYSYNTVVQVVNQAKGLCQCGSPLASASARYCEKCAEVQRRSKAKRYRSLQAAAVCTRCAGPRDSQRSYLCAACRHKRNEIQHRYDDRHGPKQRLNRYSGLWGMVMERDHWQCRACGEPAKDVHHLDRQTETIETMVAVCRSCHIALTILGKHPNRAVLLTLLEAL